QAVAGVATFAGLSTTLTGTRTLSVTDGSLTSATSNSFTMSPALATHLVIATQPSDTVAGSDISTVTVDIVDRYGNVVTTDNSAVTVSTSGALNGATTEVSV